jgi:hypothetical protein
MFHVYTGEMPRYHVPNPDDKPFLRHNFSAELIIREGLPDWASFLAPNAPKYFTPEEMASLPSAPGGPM